MIQELLGGAGLLAGERKISINGGGILEAASTLPHSLSPSPSPCPSSSAAITNATASTATASAATATATSSSNSENLRCPRCDSSNTKFCYYNNYNLTQPRHFCKTCRRYWTKGGALRNVPIGGGCRKNKSSTVASASGGKSITSAVKMKMVATEIGVRSGFVGAGKGLEPNLSSTPILWGSPQNSHMLALLRSAHQNPNPNPLCSSTTTSLNVKEEGNNSNGRIIGSHMMSTTTDHQSSAVPNGTVNIGRSKGLDPLGQVPSLGLCSSFWRSSSNNSQNHHQQNVFNFTQLGEAAQSNTSTSGIQELYQRLRSTATTTSSSSSANISNYYNDHTAVVLTHHHLGSNSSHSSSSSTNSASTTSSSILESSPVVGVGGGELGFWNNQAFSWSDLPTSNGRTAYP